LLTAIWQGVMQVKSILGVVLLVILGCEAANPVQPTPLAEPSPAICPAPPSWPIIVDGDGFGKEDQRYAPAPFQCRPGYTYLFYNGHNWLCQDPDGNHRYPNKGGFE
jgi:hypothetical protein